MEIDPELLTAASQEFEPKNDMIEHHRSKRRSSSSQQQQQQHRRTSDILESLLDRRHSPTYIDLDDASVSWREYTSAEYVQYIDEKSKAALRKAELAEIRSRRKLVKQKEVFDTESSVSGSSTISATTLAAFFTQQRLVQYQIRKNKKDSIEYLRRYNRCKSGEVVHNILTTKIENQKESPYFRTSPILSSTPNASSSSSSLTMGSGKKDEDDIVQKGNTREKVITYNNNNNNNNKYDDEAILTSIPKMEALVEEERDGVVVLHSYQKNDEMMSHLKTIQQQHMIFHFNHHHDIELLQQQQHILAAMMRQDENLNPTTSAALCRMAVSPTTTTPTNQKNDPSDTVSSIPAEMEYLKLEVLQGQQNTIVVSGDGLRPETAYVVVEAQSRQNNKLVIQEDPSKSNHPNEEEESSSSPDSTTTTLASTTTTPTSSQPGNDNKNDLSDVNDNCLVQSHEAAMSKPDHIATVLTDENLVQESEHQQHPVETDPKEEKETTEDSNSVVDNDNNNNTLTDPSEKLVEEPNTNQHSPQKEEDQPLLQEGDFKEDNEITDPDQNETEKNEKLQLVISDDDHDDEDDDDPKNILQEEDDASTEIATILESPQEKETAISSNNNTGCSSPIIIQRQSRLIPPKQRRLSLVTSSSHKSPTTTISFPRSESKRISRIPRCRSSSSGLRSPSISSFSSANNRSNIAITKLDLDNENDDDNDEGEESVYSKEASLSSSIVSSSRSGRWSLGMMMSNSNHTSQKSSGRRSLNPAQQLNKKKTKSLLLIRVPLYVGLSKERLERRKQLKCCDGTYIPKLHRKIGGCERCLYWASEEEKQQFETSGHQIRIMMVRGGCHRNCKIFPRTINEHPVRLCRKCFFDTHQGQEH